MTGLASDLSEAIQAHGSLPDSFRAVVPLGLLRACLIQVTRFDAGPLHDRGREARLRAEDEARAENEREAA